MPQLVVACRLDADEILLQVVTFGSVDYVLEKKRE